MYSEGWRPGADADQAGEIKAAELGWREVVSLFIFFGQYIVITVYGLIGDSSQLYPIMAAIMTVSSILIGIINGMSADDLGNTYAKGCASMAFVGLVIGMARSVSLVLTAGNVLHTIVYVITLPLMGLPRWVSSMGMMLVISVINPIIPSASSKAAILVPIIKPIGEVLNLAPEMIVQAFQFGDGFTNMVSPLLGWTVGSVAMVNVPFPKWVKWALPKVLTFLLLSSIIIVLLTVAGWTFAI